MIKMTMLIENLVYRRGLVSEHGFSLLIQADSSRILFDTGQSSQFIRNASLMNIDLSTVNACVISHGHYDHTGGLGHFMQMNKTADIWISSNALVPKYSKNNTYIGIPDLESLDQARFKDVQKITPIADHIYIMPAAKIYVQDETPKDQLYIKQNNLTREDPFIDEQSLVVVKDNKLTIISGCSHRGITNIIQSAVDYFGLPVSLVLGGFHLNHESDSVVDRIVEKLNTLNIDQMGISHCTGVERFAYLKRAFKGKLFYNYSGNSLDI